MNHPACAGGPASHPARNRFSLRLNRTLESRLRYVNSRSAWGEVGTSGEGTAAPPGRPASEARDVRGVRDVRDGSTRRATIRDVAESAGVSVGTASKALNGQG